jgi:hypothetical protein
MITKLILPVLLLFIFIQDIYPQKISNIDFDDIKVKTTDSTSEFYYPNLKKKFFNNVKEMSDEELKMFYYGNVFTEEYEPLGPDFDDETKMGDYYESKRL